VLDDATEGDPVRRLIPERAAKAPAAAAAALAFGLASGLTGCNSIGKPELPEKAPPLVDMEEPVAFLQEPRDEAARTALPAGSFTGATVAEAKRSLEQLSGGEGGGGVRVARVVENSPADAAGIEEEDLLLAVKVGAAPGRELRWPSEWRKLEVETAPGTDVDVTIDRAGEERTVHLRTEPRVHPAERAAAERFREEKRVGVVLRTATEVEARAAGLGPGGGAVVVGLSAASPWRAGGLRFGDLLTAIDGTPVAHPQQVLAAITAAGPDDHLQVRYLRGGAKNEASLGVSRREQEVREISIPLLYSYEHDRGISDTSVLLGLWHMRSTEAAWQLDLLWLFTFSGGDADRLVEVKE
jgi:predicted metalloprotease with PDZ domain